MLLDRRRIYLIIYLLLAGVLLLASYYYSNRLEYNLLENNFVHLKEQTDQQNRLIRAKIQSQINAVTLLSDTVATIPDFPSLLHTIAPKYGFDSGYEQVFYINPKGLGQAPIAGSINISTESYFNDLNKGHTVMTSIRRSASAMSFFIIAPIEADGINLGYIANEIDSTYLYSIIAPITDSNVYMYILDELGNTIALANNGYALQVKDSLSASLQNVVFKRYNAEFLADAHEFEEARQNEVAAFFNIDFQGNVRLAYMTPVGLQGWSVVAFLPAEAVSNAAFSIQRNFNIFTFVSLLIIGLFLFYTIIVNIRNQNLKTNLIKELTTRATIDKLTKVYTKSDAEARIGTYLKFTHDTDVSALLVIDIDNFESINVHYGDEYGDVVLREIAENIKSSFRSTDIVGRTAGTQFVVLVHKIQNKDLVTMKAEQLTGMLNKLQIAQDSDSTLTASIGIAMCPYNGVTYNDLYKNADAAMFYAKQNGKNAYVFYDKAKHLEVKHVHSRKSAVIVKDHIMEMHRLEATLVSLLYGASDRQLASKEFVRRVADSLKIPFALIVDYDIENKAFSFTSEYTAKSQSPISPLIQKGFDEEIPFIDIINSSSTILEVLASSEKSEKNLPYFLHSQNIQSAVFVPFFYTEKRRGFLLLATNQIHYRWQRHLYPCLALIARLYSLYGRENHKINT